MARSEFPLNYIDQSPQMLAPLSGPGQTKWRQSGTRSSQQKKHSHGHNYFKLFLFHFLWPLFSLSFLPHFILFILLSRICSRLLVSPLVGAGGGGSVAATSSTSTLERLVWCVLNWWWPNEVEAGAQKHSYVPDWRGAGAAPAGSQATAMRPSRQWVLVRGLTPVRSLPPSLALALLSLRQLN